jgi:hypothetical protein
MVIQNLLANAENAKKVVAHALPRISQIANDSAEALKGALFTDPKAMKAATKKKLAPLISKYVK